MPAEDDDQSTEAGSASDSQQNVPGTSHDAGFRAPRNAMDSPLPPPTSFSSTIPPDPNVAIRAASQLPPVPYTPDPNPGGFVPYEPSGNNPPQPLPLYGDSSSTTVAKLSPDQVAKAQKYCKWASSALNYDDVKTAIDNLRYALQLLQTGQDPA